MKDTYLYVGNWSFHANPARGKGISIFKYDTNTGKIDFIETIRSEIAAGQLYLDKNKGVLYVNDERGERYGSIGGGGYVRSFKIEESGRLTETSCRETLMPEPSYMCMDKSNKYLVTCHCSDPFNVTKIRLNEDGTFYNEVLFDDTGLTMHEINDDGSLGKIADIALTSIKMDKENGGKKSVDPVSGHIQLVKVISRLHSVVLSPSGKMLTVCDKGMDRVYTYKVDAQKGKLVRLDCWEAPEDACFPRYSSYHPTKNIVYVNNENIALLNSFHYDDITGKLERFDKLYLLEEDPGLVDGKRVGAQDILVHPNGNTLYCTLCGLNLIVVLKLDSQGKPLVVQRINCRGIFPRGIVLTPDNKYLLSGNMLSGDITIFEADDNGLLKDTGETVKAVSPSAMKFY